jgi:hypothetical protein
MIGEGDCGAIGGMKIGRGNQSTWRISYLLYFMLYTYLHSSATEWAGIVLIGLICVQEVHTSNPVWRLPVLTSLILLSTSVHILRYYI